MYLALTCNFYMSSISQKDVGAISKLFLNTTKVQGCVDLGRWEASHPPNIFYSHAGRDLAALFSGTFFFLVTIVGQLVKTPPPQQKVPRHINAKFDQVYSFRFVKWSSSQCAT